jgi:glycosyltransferase involved in cell wall biosynthesis
VSARRARRRLLTIGHSYTVGANRRLAQELAVRGDWEVTVAAPRRFRGDFRSYELHAEPDEAYALEPLSAPFTQPVHLMVYGRRLRELLRRPWDLVHCWEEPYVASAGQVASWTPKAVPLVVATFQNIDKRYPPPFSWIERRTLRRADGVIAFGRTAQDVLQTRPNRVPNVRTIPPGVDTGQFAPDAAARERVRDALGWTDETPVVGFMGRFVAEKGVDWLTGVLNGLTSRWRALFVGAGPLERHLRAWAERHPGRVAIETSVRHHEVPAWLNAMDVLCAPSRTTPRWREQFGRMLIEAFACGVPVVASDSGEIPHVVGEAGIVLPEGDVDTWRRVINALLADEGSRLALGGRGRARAVETFDWAVVASQHAAFFAELLAGRRTTAPPA